MKTRRAPRSTPTTGREWLGARITAPFWVGTDNPVRPEMCVWMELPEGVIVALDLIDPDGPERLFGDTLVEAMADPKHGQPRRPGFVRVADEEMAAEVRRVLPDVPVMVAPTPEFEEFVESLKQMPGSSGGPDADWDPETLFPEGHDVDPEVGSRFFRAAQALHQLAPWKVVSDAYVIRLDIPALGVTGGCLSIMGLQGESFGLVLFPSFEAYVRFGEAGEKRRRPIDLGTDFLSLEYLAEEDLPPGLARTIQRHGWPVDGDAFPTVSHLDRHGEPQPVPEADVRVMAACAAALAVTFAKHRRMFADEEYEESISESYFDVDGVETRVTVPGESWVEFEPGLSEETDLSPGLLDSPELSAIALAMKTKHYADWVDHPLPALDGRTPRTAARSKAGRRQLEVLLKDMEEHEARGPKGQRYDFSGIRAELGLES